MGLEVEYKLYFIHQDKNYLSEVKEFIERRVKDCEDNKNFKELLIKKGVKLPKGDWPTKIWKKAREYDFEGFFEVGKIKPFEYADISFNEALQSRSKPCLPVYEDDIKKCSSGYRFELIHERTEGDRWIPMVNPGPPGKYSGEKVQKHHASVMSFILDKFPDLMVRGWFISSTGSGQKSGGRVSDDSRDWLYGIDEYWGKVFQQMNPEHYIEGSSCYNGDCILTKNQAFEAFNSAGFLDSLASRLRFIPLSYSTGLSDELDASEWKLLRKKLLKFYFEDELPIDSNGCFKLCDEFLESSIKSFSHPTDNWINLSQLKKIDVESAKKLAEYEGDSIDLGGLVCMSDSVARELKKYQGTLYLCKYYFSDEEDRTELQKKFGFCDPYKQYDNLSVYATNGSTTITLQKHFPEDESDLLIFNQVKSLTKSLKIDTRNGNLAFPNLKKLSDTAAKSLSKYRSLQLNGLTSLSASAAKSLSKCVEIQLNGLTSLSASAAKSLSKCDLLFLNGLTVLSDVAAKSLSKCESKCVEIQLNGLTSLSASVAKSLSKCEELHLNGLTGLSEKVAKELVQGYFYKIELNGLTTIDESIAKIFADNKGEIESLHLNGITTLSDAAAKALAVDWDCLELPPKMKKKVNRFRQT